MARTDERAPLQANDELQAEDMYGRPTGPRHEDIPAPRREAARGQPQPRSGERRVDRARNGETLRWQPPRGGMPDH
jgi:hypothetical protein